MGLTPPKLDDIGGWPGVLSRLTARRDLTRSEASSAFDEILVGAASPVQIAAFVAALRTKGETVEEMTGAVEAMRARAVALDLGAADDVVDTCGTGGDRSGSINVSTISALVLAGSGTRVCKHGGRAASSLAGSADVLEALGVAIELGPAGVRRCVEEAGIGFCFAPRYHSAMRHAAPVRRELGVATVFNFLGPLANPARVRRQVVGVGDSAMAERMLGVLEANGAIHAMVVHGDDGLDELSTTAASTVIESRAGEGRTTYRVDPEELGLTRRAPEELRPTGGAGAGLEASAQAARAVIAGEPGPHRDVVLLNTAAGLVVAGRVENLREGIVLAAATIDSGAAGAALEHLVRVSRQAAESGL